MGQGSAQGCWGVGWSWGQGVAGVVPEVGEGDRVGEAAGPRPQQRRVQLPGSSDGKVAVPPLPLSCCPC